MHPKIRVSIRVVVLLVTSLGLISCGAFEDDNNQPAIGPITDQTLDVGDKTTVDLNITDADIDDTHAITAFSDDTTVATVSVGLASITITAKAERVVSTFGLTIPVFVEITI
jgi:hypothetical protein